MWGRVFDPKALGDLKDEKAPLALDFALAPVVVGTQFAAAAGVKPLRAALLINGANAAWAIAIASLMLLIGLDRWAQFA